MLRQLEFSVPNQVVREQMYDFMLESYRNEDLQLWDCDVEEMCIDMALNGNWRPFFIKIADTIRNYSSNRDKQKGESYVHGFTFASVLRNICQFRRMTMPPVIPTSTCNPDLATIRSCSTPILWSSNT